MTCFLSSAFTSGEATAQLYKVTTFVRINASQHIILLKSNLSAQPLHNYAEFMLLQYCQKLFFPMYSTRVWIGKLQILSHGMCLHTHLGLSCIKFEFQNKISCPSGVPGLQYWPELWLSLLNMKKLIRTQVLKRNWRSCFVPMKVSSRNPALANQLFHQIIFSIIQITWTPTFAFRHIFRVLSFCVYISLSSYFYRPI